ncbi:anti-sigma factor domain-containing protein [Mesorhizobium sp. Root157]|uniref:anti-sigma factor n=1 Tax=Mesorhizobium sp. Root157 TaxID=1736477 RepID=UPI000AF6D4D3|nr:anti-sigma factor [Mesorhizobium sp. Root157]
MTLSQENGPERESDDLLAAEYVLGVLLAEQRQEASRRIDAEPAFARLVDAWEVRLSPLAEAYPEAEPPRSLKAAIDGRLFASPGAAPRASVWTSLGFWRGLAVAALAGLVLTVALPYMQPPAEQMRLVASLAADSSDVKYLAVYDAAHHNVGLSHLSGERDQGKDFELWMIEGDKPPVSLGVIPVGAVTQLPVAPPIQKQLEQGAVLAVSVEPAGGSPTGQPTGPVVATGDLKNI